MIAPTGRLGMFGMSSIATGKTRRPLSALRAALALPWLRFHPIALMNANNLAL